MRKIATLAAVLALATAQAGSAQTSQQDGARQSAASPYGQGGAPTAARFVRTPEAIIISLLALGTFITGFVAAVKNHHGSGGGRPTSP